MTNMKINLSFLLLFGVFFLLNSNVKAQQSFTCVIDTNVIVDTVGSEMVFYLDITNTSSHNLTLFIARTVNNLPSEWTSSLCYDINCLPPSVDTVIADNDPLPPDSTVECSLHVTAINNNGTAFVYLVVGDYNNLTDTVGYGFTASTVPIMSVRNNYSPTGYSLKQNYPNPFNPSTNIEFSLKKQDHVRLEVYDILGNRVASILNEIKPAGDYTINFNASNLPSGVYIYRLIANNFMESKKMLLLK